INTAILQITAADGYKTIKTLGSGAFGKPLGAAIDGAGNLYEADYGGACSYEFTAASGYATTERLCTQGFIAYPEALALDGAGNLYRNDVVNNSIYKMDFIDPPSMLFRTATLQGVPDVQDGPQLLHIQNNGTAPLNFSSIVFSNASFTFDNITTCSTTTPLAIGSSCYIAVDFQPTATGPVSATGHSDDSCKSHHGKLGNIHLQRHADSHHVCLQYRFASLLRMRQPHHLHRTERRPAQLPGQGERRRRQPGQRGDLQLGRQLHRSAGARHHVCSCVPDQRRHRNLRLHRFAGRRHLPVQP